MPSYSKENREYHKSRIRAVLVIKPNASEREIETTLEKSATAPLKLDRAYIRKIKNGILRERTHRNNRAAIGERISRLQDKIKALDEQLWAIAGDKNAKARDRVQALKVLAQNELDTLKAEMDAGIYERKLGTLDLEARRSAPIDEDHQTNILQAFKNWGFIKEPPQTIEAEVITQPHDQPHPDPTTHPGPAPSQH